MTVRTPSVHRRTGLPAAVEIYEVGARDGLQNEAAVGADGHQSRVHQPDWSPPGCGRSKPPPSCPPSGCRNSATPRSSSRCWSARPACAIPVLVPNPAGLERARAAGARKSRCSDQPPRPSPGATSTARSTNRSRCSRRWSPPPASEGMWVRAYVSMCFGDPWEGDVPVRQVVDDRRPPGGHGSPGAQRGRHHRRGHPGARVRSHRRPGRGRDPAGRCRRPLSRHLRPGPGQHPRRPRSRGHHHRRLGRRSRGLPVRRERHRQPGHRGPGLAAARPGHRHRRRPRRPGGDQHLDGRPARPAQPVAGRAGSRRGR